MRLVHEVALGQFSVRVSSVFPTYLYFSPLLCTSVSMEAEISTPREMRAGVPQGFVLSPTFYNMYINDAPQTPGVHLALFADDACLYATDRKEVFVVRKLQRGLSSMETWCECWNIKINEDEDTGDLLLSQSSAAYVSSYTTVHYITVLNISV
jgi:hypothetical protein